jgi:hypothetical protein
MLAAEGNPFVVAFVGTSFWGIDKRVVPVVVDGDHASPWGQEITSLMGEGAVLTLMPVQ